MLNKLRNTGHVFETAVVNPLLLGNQTLDQNHVAKPFTHFQQSTTTMHLINLQSGLNFELLDVGEGKPWKRLIGLYKTCAKEDIVPINNQQSCALFWLLLCQPHALLSQFVQQRVPYATTRTAKRQIRLIHNNLLGPLTAEVYFNGEISLVRLKFDQTAGMVFVDYIELIEPIIKRVGILHLCWWWTVARLLIWKSQTLRLETGKTLRELIKKTFTVVVVRFFNSHLANK